MASIATPNATAGESAGYKEIAAIERVLTSSFGASAHPFTTGPAARDAMYYDLSAATAGDTASKPCHDQDHQVSLIDVAGPSAAAIVNFTDCSGASFSDLYVLQKHNDQWAISEKVWDSHAHS